MRINGKFWHTISVFDYRRERWREEIGASFAVHPLVDIKCFIDSSLIYFRQNFMRYNKFSNLILIRKILNLYINSKHQIKCKIIHIKLEMYLIRFESP